jgi:hypothetical protein
VLVCVIMRGVCWSYGIWHLVTASAELLLANSATCATLLLPSITPTQAFLAALQKCTSRLHTLMAQGSPHALWATCTPPATKFSAL